jgi:uncharacterized BrkB/YihY/UPF0761 family membrane protein
MADVEQSKPGSIHVHTVLGFIVILLVAVIIFRIPQQDLLNPDKVLSAVSPLLLFITIGFVILWMLFKLVYTWRHKEETEEN